MMFKFPAVAIALTAMAAPAAAQQAAAPAAAAPAHPTLAPSARAKAAIIALDTAIKANDTATIPAKIAAAQAVASTKEDRYLIGTMRLKAALAAKDNAGMIAAVDAVAASGYENSDAVATLYDALGTSLYKDKQFPQAAAALQKAVALTPGNGDILLNLGEAQFAMGQPSAAVATFRRALAAASSGGRKPSEQMYRRAVSIAYSAKLPEAIEISRDWARAYPSADSWRNSIGIFRNQTHPDTQGILDLMRLMQVTHALTQSEDYAVFIAAAAEQLNFNEAQKVYDAGLAAGTIDPTKPQFVEIRNLLKVKAKATTADLESAITMAPNPTNLLRIGDRFYAMGDYARAAKVYRDVMTKAGGDRDLANLHLGMALARSGDKAGAIAAFNAVTGPRADIAKYWLMFVQQQG